MDIQKVEHLLEKFFEGNTSLKEEKQLRAFFSREKVPDHLQTAADQFHYLELSASAKAETDPMTKIKILDTDRSPLEAGRDSISAEFRREDTRTRTGPQQWSLRIAAGIILLLLGFSAGLLVERQNTASGKELVALQEEVRQIKSTLAYGTYTQQASAGERISAVNRSVRLQGAGQLDSVIAEILISTLNNDTNINVRFAAAESLFRLRSEVETGWALATALSRQTDPLMQLTLIDMLVQIQEKSAVNEMQKMLMLPDTEEIVRDRLLAGIAELET